MWTARWVGVSLPFLVGASHHLQGRLSRHALAEAALGPRKEDLTRELEGRLEEAHIPKGGPVWARAWKHHWARLVCEAWGVEGEG